MCHYNSKVLNAGLVTVFTRLTFPQNCCYCLGKSFQVEKQMHSFNVATFIIDQIVSKKCRAVMTDWDTRIEQSHH